MQRMSACKNERHAILATIFYAIFQTARPWMWVGVALVSIVLFPDLSGTEYTDTDTYALVMNRFLGPGMKGLLITAFLAAFMSTIDTHLNWGASYLMTDVYQRFFKKNSLQSHYIIVTKIIVVLLMVAGACLVPFMNSIEGAWVFLALLMAGSGMIHFARWFWWRINAYTEITALTLGLIGGILHLTLPDSVVLFGFPWSELPFEIEIALYTGVIVPISIVVTYMTPCVPVEKLEAFYRKVRPGGFWGILSEKTLALPGKAVNKTTLVDITAGIFLCFGISLGVGYAILLQPTKSAFCLFLALIGGIRDIFLVSKRSERVGTTSIMQIVSVITVNRH